jgi:uncharacterized protein (TIGR02145 family)
MFHIIVDIMVKKLVWAAIALPLVLLSCKGEEDPIDKERVPVAIGFSASSVTPLQENPVSRVASLDLVGLKGTGFRVNAYSTGAEAWSTAKGGSGASELMANQAVTWDGSAWMYTPVKYWPDLVDATNYGKASFFAWNNFGVNASTVVYGRDAAGTPTLTCTVPDTSGSQYDLVTDVVTDRTGGASGSSVDLAFSHILSRIGFTAKLDKPYPGKTANILSLIVRYADQAVESKGVYTFGTGNHGLGAWSYPASDKTYMSGTEQVGSYVTLDNIGPLEAVRLNKDDKYLMLLPQTVIEGDVMADIIWTVDDIMQSQTVDLPAQEWRPGYSYDYNLVISLSITEPEPEPSSYSVAFESVSVNTWNATNVSIPSTFAYNGETGDNVTDGMTNCYLVVPGQEVTFPVSRAYTYEDGQFTNTLRVGEAYTGAFRAAVVWDDNTVINGTPTVAGAGKTAEVTVKTNSGRQGNALVKIYKEDDAATTPVWSYHIWVTDYDGAATATTANGHVFMDRNLGATEAALTTAGRGLLYQWGRKDPFPGSGTAGSGVSNMFYGLGDAVAVPASDNVGATVESIRNPTRFYGYYTYPTYDWLPVRDNLRWNTTAHTKSIHDPCPAGWRVPIHVNNVANEVNSPWYGYSNQTFSSGTGANWGENALYPATGYRSFGNGSLTGSGGTSGYYWSASSYGSSSYQAAYLLFNSTGNVYVYNGYNRSHGYSVRCVKE